MDEKITEELFGRSISKQEAVRRNIEVCISVLKMLEQCKNVDMRSEIQNATKKKLLEHVNRLSVDDLNR